jgi:hypothetical protein
MTMICNCKYGCQNECNFYKKQDVMTFVPINRTVRQSPTLYYTDSGIKINALTYNLDNNINNNNYIKNSQSYGTPSILIGSRISTGQAFAAFGSRSA